MDSNESFGKALKEELGKTPISFDGIIARKRLESMSEAYWCALFDAIQVLHDAAEESFENKEEEASGLIKAAKILIEMADDFRPRK